MKNNIIRDVDGLKAAIREAGMATALAARDGEPHRVAMERDTLERLVCVLEDLESGLLDIQWLGETGFRADPDDREEDPIRFSIIIRSAKHLVEEVTGVLKEPWAKDAIVLEHLLGTGVAF